LKPCARNPRPNRTARSRRPSPRLNAYCKVLRPSASNYRQRPTNWRWRGKQLLEATSGFLATRAIAGGGQNRPADCLQFHLAASAYLGEVFLLFLVHCDRPFVGPVYEVILALVRNVRNGVIQRHAEVSARCLFLSIADIGCGAFTRARPSPPEPIATELSRIRIKLQISVLCRGVFAPVEPRQSARTRLQHPLCRSR